MSSQTKKSSVISSETVLFSRSSQTEREKKTFISPVIRLFFLKTGVYYQMEMGRRSLCIAKRKVRTPQSRDPSRNRRVPRTICRGKESATERKPPDSSGKGETAG